MSSLVDSLIKTIFHRAAVCYKAKLSPHTYHIRLQADALRTHSYVAGEHLRLFVGVDKPAPLSDMLRTYSIWQHSAAEGTVDIAVCMHSPGPGALWAEQVQVGDIIYYKGPTAKLIADTSAPSYLLVGDDSSLSHLYAIRRGIPMGKKITGIAYASDQQDLFSDIDGSRPFQYVQLFPYPTEKLISHIKVLKKDIASDTMVYLAGDARVCKVLSRFLKEDMNINGSQIRSRGFWMPGKTGMD